MEEIEVSDWRDIPGYRGIYQISRMGQVRSWKWRYDRQAQKPRLLRPYTRKESNTLFVKLTPPDGGRSKDVSVISLMRDVWMRGELTGLVVFHKDGNVRDNCLQNLAYITRAELGRLTGAKSKRRPVAKIDCAGEIVEVYPSARRAAKANYVSYQAVMDRCNGKVKKPFALGGYSYVWDE